MTGDRGGRQDRRLIPWLGIVMAAAGAAGAVIILPPERPAEWFELICFGLLALCGLGIVIETRRARARDADEQ